MPYHYSRRKQRSIANRTYSSEARWWRNKGGRAYYHGRAKYPHAPPRQRRQVRRAIRHTMWRGSKGHRMTFFRWLFGK